MPELRKDPIMGRWVIVSTERNSRPSDYKFPADLGSDDTANCPFCPGNEHLTPPEILAYHPPGRKPNTRDWWVRVIPNKYPALRIESEPNRKGEGMYDRMGGFGAHEVIIESPAHNVQWGDMSEKSLRDVIWAFRDRTIELKKDTRIRYVLIFKNHGRAAGATLSHPHSQLIGLPMVPIRVQQEMIGAKNYYAYKERCVFCDIVSEELASGKRLIGSNEHFVSLAPYASRFPFETWIIPAQHSCHFETINEKEADSLASILKLSLKKISSHLGNPPFNMTIHSTPIGELGTPHYHWHIEIMPKLTHVAGFESGSGFYINPMPPETAAELLNRH
ncbi:MAG: galactose-1-phosphate uridylyltransferase [Elusimicrobia bacterium]|nr:galactose-1-phosphate uridylyltransferase [Elusimicrobiota bacterium]